MEYLLEYQQIIIRSTYTRNKLDFPFENGKIGLKELIKRITEDMKQFAPMDQKLVQSLLNMLQKEADNLPADESEPADETTLAAAKTHNFKTVHIDDTDYCAICDEYICGEALECTRCYYLTHPKCAPQCHDQCITMTSIRGARVDTGSSASSSAVDSDSASAAGGTHNKEPLYEDGDVYAVYDRLGVLGKGGCGVVYKVQHKETGEYFALKQMKKDSYMLDVLEREIRIMKSFDHVGLTKLLCAYKDEKFIYLIMDYVAGGELFDKIAELESFDEQDAADVTRQLLQALNYLHERGCAHRDIKAENILLVDKDGTQVKIADFGLANTLGNQSKFMSFVGTTPYMAPEVLSGASYGCGVDMWSLGVLTFVMLAGFMPFSGKTEMQEIRAILGGQYKFDEKRGWDKISNAAKHFISNLLLQDPEARYTAKQALNHPWIRASSQAKRKSVALPSLGSLKDLQDASKKSRGGAGVGTPGTGDKLLDKLNIGKKKVKKKKKKEDKNDE